MKQLKLKFLLKNYKLNHLNFNLIKVDKQIVNKIFLYIINKIIKFLFFLKIIYFKKNKNKIIFNYFRIKNNIITGKFNFFFLSSF